MKSWAGIGVHGMALENALYICGGQCERVVHILWECPAKRRQYAEMHLWLYFENCSANVNNSTSTLLTLL